MSKSYTFKRNAVVSFLDDNGVRETPSILVPEKVEVGLFISDAEAERYARIYGYDQWDATEVLDAAETPLDASVVPDAPGEAFANAFEPLFAAEGVTSDAATTVADDTLVAANVIQYDVTLTLEVRVPVYAADKAHAIDTVDETRLDALLNNSGAKVRRIKTQARVHA